MLLFLCTFPISPLTSELFPLSFIISRRGGRGIPGRIPCIRIRIDGRKLSEDTAEDTSEGLVAWAPELQVPGSSPDGFTNNIS